MEHRQKEIFFSRPLSSADLHPKKSLWPDFRDRGVIFRATDCVQKE